MQNTEIALEIEKRFKISWQDTEAFYDDLIGNSGWAKLITVRNFIAELKSIGEDKHFRLGTALSNLVFSRSVEHGLRPDQKYVVIETITANDFEVRIQEGSHTYRKYRMADLHDERLTKLLNTLKSTLID